MNNPSPPAAAAALPIIAIGCDHAGLPLKSFLLAHLRDGGYEVSDLGVNRPDRADYPDYAHAVCRAVEQGAARYGVLVCGTGVGMSIAANRHTAIRCAHASDPLTARLARAHNDANVIAVGSRVIGEEMGVAILHEFLSTPYEGGRHDLRLAKLAPA